MLNTLGIMSVFKYFGVSLFRMLTITHLQKSREDTEYSSEYGRKGQIIMWTCVSPAARETNETLINNPPLSTSATLSKVIISDWSSGQCSFPTVKDKHSNEQQNVITLQSLCSPLLWWSQWILPIGTALWVGNGTEERPLRGHRFTGPRECLIRFIFVEKGD